MLVQWIDHFDEEEAGEKFSKCLKATGAAATEIEELSLVRPQFTVGRLLPRVLHCARDRRLGCHGCLAKEAGRVEISVFSGDKPIAWSRHSFDLRIQRSLEYSAMTVRSNRIIESLFPLFAAVVLTNQSQIRWAIHSFLDTLYHPTPHLCSYAMFGSSETWQRNLLVDTSSCTS